MRVVGPGSKGGDWTACHTTSSSIFHLFRAHSQWPYLTVRSASQRRNLCYNHSCFTLNKPPEISLCCLHSSLFSFCDFKVLQNISHMHRCFFLKFVWVCMSLCVFMGSSHLIWPERRREKSVCNREQQGAKSQRQTVNGCIWMCAYVLNFVFIVFVCICGFLWLSVLFFINDKKPLDGSLTPFFNES